MGFLDIADARMGYTFVLQANLVSWIWRRS